MVQKKLLSEVLRRRTPGTSESFASSSRQRSDSVSSSVSRENIGKSHAQKRKPDDYSDQYLYNSYASVVGGYSKQEPILTQSQVESLEEIFKKVNESEKTLKSTLANFDISPEFAEVLNTMLGMISMLSLSQSMIVLSVKSKLVQTEVTPSFDYAMAAQKIPRTSQQTSGESAASSNWQPAMHVSGHPLAQGYDASEERRAQQGASATASKESEHESKVKKFKKAVEDAERSTLVLNLNLGRTRIINEETISTNVSKALISMTAKVENPNSTVPSNDAIDAIDDVISTAKKMTFFGKATRSVRNTKDKSLNGSYMTIPVKYEFADRGTKFFCDEVLRKTCNAQLAVPYPTVLREGIKQIVDKYKKQFPDHFIKVLVDTRRMQFKISRRLSKDSEWIRIPDVIPIPDCCLEIQERDIPEGFKIPWPPDPAEDGGGEDMEESPQQNDPPGSQDGP